MHETPVPEKSERAAPDVPVVAFREQIRSCPVCGQAMTGRKTSACSDKCRAAKSRRRRMPLPISEARAIRTSLTTALEAVYEAKAILDRCGRR